jgi:hypothetical protein
MDKNVRNKGKERWKILKKEMDREKLRNKKAYGIEQQRVKVKYGVSSPCLFGLLRTVVLTG